MSTSIMLTIGVLIGLVFILKFSEKLLNSIARKKQVAKKRLYYVVRFFNILLIMTAIVMLAFVWSVDIKGISVLASSLFAIIGVALFAQWSILSNITASIIIFFSFPAKVGDRVRILDGDNTVDGKVKDIALFQIAIIDSDGNTVFYPNNLLLQKPVIKIAEVSHDK